MKVLLVSSLLVAAVFGQINGGPGGPDVPEGHGGFYGPESAEKPAPRFKWGSHSNEKTDKSGSVLDLPDFVKNLPQQAQDSLTAIIKDTTVRISDQEAALAKWAADNDVTDQYNAYVKEQEDKFAKLKDGTATFIGRLKTAADAFVGVISNKDLSRDQQAESIRGLTSLFGNELRVLKLIGKLVSQPKPAVLNS